MRDQIHPEIISERKKGSDEDTYFPPEESEPPHYQNAMKVEIDWGKELLESGRFNHQFSKDLLENASKISCKVYILGICYPDGKRSGVQIRMLNQKIQGKQNIHLKGLKEKLNNNLRSSIKKLANNQFSRSNPFSQHSLNSPNISPNTFRKK